MPTVKIIQGDHSRKEALIMEKTFFIRKSATGDEVCAPAYDRFQRIEKLNLLVDSGWVIKSFKCDANEEYFILEKADQ